MRLLCLITALFVGILLSVSSAAEEDLFIDKGACPGERCTYCEIIRATSEFTIYKAASKDSERIGRISVGDVFISKSGEVHTLPEPFTVIKERGIFKPGDEVFILTYSGEGYYRVRHNGKLVSGADLGDHPWSDRPIWRCNDDDQYCWGELSGPIQSIWWIYVQSENGAEGWIAYLDSFKQDPME